MNKSWLRREGQKWVEDNLITAEQLHQIVNKYPDKEKTGKFTGILPLLASILIGLSILSFIASNWSGISPFLRLIILIVILLGFYMMGEKQLRKGNEPLGTALNLLGIITFGASIILLGQTFNLSAVDARLFIFWSIPAVFYLFRDRHRVYFLLLIALSVGGQLYSMGEFQSFSYLLFIIFFFSSGAFVYLYTKRLDVWLFTFGFSINVLIFMNVQDFNFLWYFLFGIFMYTISAWFNHPIFKQAFKRTGTVIAFSFAYSLYFILTNGFYSDFNLPHGFYYLITFFVLLALFFYSKTKHNETIVDWEFLIFLPYFYLVSYIDHLFVGLIYLIVMFVYSGFMLASGYREEQRSKINFGIVLFLLVCLMGYFNLAWSFMPKSLFFLMGGILLFLLNAFLQRKKKQILKNGGPHHD